GVLDDLHVLGPGEHRLACFHLSPWPRPLLQLAQTPIPPAKSTGAVEAYVGLERGLTWRGELIRAISWAPLRLVNHGRRMVLHGNGRSGGAVVRRCTPRACAGWQGNARNVCTQRRRWQMGLGGEDQGPVAGSTRGTTWSETCKRLRCRCDQST